MHNEIKGTKVQTPFLALVALKLLVSLISRLVACSPRIVVDTHTNTFSTITFAAHARRGLIIMPTAGRYIDLGARLGQALYNNLLIVSTHVIYWARAARMLSRLRLGRLKAVASA